MIHAVPLARVPHRATPQLCPLVSSAFAVLQCVALESSCAGGKVCQCTGSEPRVGAAHVGVVRWQGRAAHQLEWRPQLHASLLHKLLAAACVAGNKWCFSKQKCMPASECPSCDVSSECARPPRSDNACRVGSCASTAICVTRSVDAQADGLTAQG